MSKQGKLLLLSAVASSFFASTAALGECVTNRLASNELVANRLASNKLAANRLASNKIILNRLASNRLASNGLDRPSGEGAVLEVRSILLPDGTSFGR